MNSERIVCYLDGCATGVATRLACTRIGDDLAGGERRRAFLSGSHIVNRQAAILFLNKELTEAALTLTAIRVERCCTPITGPRRNAMTDTTTTTTEMINDPSAAALEARMMSGTSSSPGHTADNQDTESARSYKGDRHDHVQNKRGDRVSPVRHEPGRVASEGEWDRGQQEEDGRANDSDATKDTRPHAR